LINSSALITNLKELSGAYLLFAHNFESKLPKLTFIFEKIQNSPMFLADLKSEKN
jgi:hypothetical protein